MKFSKKLITVSASMLMGISPLVTMNTVYASSSNVIISKASIVKVSKTTYLLDQNGKKLPVMMSKGEKIKVTAILNLSLIHI